MSKNGTHTKLAVVINTHNKDVQKHPKVAARVCARARWDLFTVDNLFFLWLDELANSHQVLSRQMSE